MAVGAIDYEGILEREGLGLVDVRRSGEHRDWRLSKDADDERIVAKQADQQAAADAFLSWARAVLEPGSGFYFLTRLDRAIWQALSDGKTYTEVARELGIDRRKISRAVQDVMVMYPGRTVQNPWRKSGRKEASNMAKEATLRQPSPYSDSASAPPEMFLYARILLRPATSGVQIKGRAVRNDRLNDVRGRPHAGGIDVMLGPSDFPGTNVVPQVITIPWWKIDQADRELVE